MGSNPSGAPAMRGPSFVRIPLGGRDGQVRAHALVSTEDAHKVQSYRWYINNNGYAVRQESIGTKRQRTVLMARVILDLDFGDPRKVDHISRDKLDNRRTNIRIVTHAENMQNQGSRKGSSRFRNVSFDKSRKTRPWVVTTYVRGKATYVGAFGTEDEAGEAALAWRREHMSHAID